MISTHMQGNNGMQFANEQAAYLQHHVEQPSFMFQGSGATHQQHFTLLQAPNQNAIPHLYQYTLKQETEEKLEENPVADQHFQAPTQEAVVQPAVQHSSSHSAEDHPAAKQETE